MSRRFRHRFVGAWASTALVVGGCVVVSQAEPAAAQAVFGAVSAFDLIDSVGVNIHQYYGDTTYADTAATTELLRRLGVRHVRDALPAGRPDQVAAIADLAAAGIRSELILDGAEAGGPHIDPAQLDELRSVASSVDAVEPTNEYDCSGDPTWVQHLHTYAAALAEAVVASPETRQLGILSPSFCHPGSVAAYGSAVGTTSAVNAHDYSAGDAPELALEGRLPLWADMTGEGLPQVVTETGYTNSLGARGAVSEATAADYTLRALLDARRLGVQRTYLYELRDERAEPASADPEQHFGLVRADGTVKPAYRAVSGLLQDLAGGAPSTVVGGPSAPRWPVDVIGGGSLLRSLTITDPDGAGQTVALWRATPLEDPVTHTRRSDPAETVRLLVPATVTATSRRPSRGNVPAALGTARSFDLPVDGAVTLVHLSAAPRPRPVVCRARAGYGAVATRYGAVVNRALLRTAGWSGAPTSATPPPALSSATSVATDQQRLRVAVPEAPTRWTVALWERTDAGSASFADFLEMPGVAGGRLRTYDLTSDVPSHMQLSAYGAPVTASSYGGEMWAQALPGSWHLLTLAGTATAMSFAVDGVAVGRVASGATPLHSLLVGALDAGFRGALGGLAVFPRVLTAAEVSHLAAAQSYSC